MIILLPMKILLYNRLNTEPVQRQFDKTLQFLQNGDFRSADVRKMKTQGFYRARLDDTNRLLFKIGEYEGEKYLFILEVILNHDYDKSRFLRGAAVQEEKLKAIYDVKNVDKEDVEEIPYLNSLCRSFTILNKFITFDENQTEILYHEAPILLLGAAGSGKTVLALEKIRQTKGRILYVTLSAFLAEKAKEIYLKDSEPIDGQEVKFASLDEYIRLFIFPKGKIREATYQDFKAWFEQIKSTMRTKDCHKIFEEIRGVLTCATSGRGYLTADEYEKLGVRQSVFPLNDRKEVYAIFEKYINWLTPAGLYDPNVTAFIALDNIRPIFDLVVVDEVQDMSTMQLSSVLKSLKRPDQFILCGDANQVVHPNFFSWTSVKRLLHQRNLNRDIIRLLPGNFRNDENIVKLANRLLALKNIRFGSIDRESNMLASNDKELEGEDNAVQFFEHTEEVVSLFNKYGCMSSEMAVIVLRESDKKAAQQQFQTPMLFTVQEAKGLEFPFVILYNFISDSSAEFASICEGVNPKDLNGQLQYNRPKDKEDRSLQAYQFYINSFYVAMTRAVEHLYIIEKEPKHRLATLLGVRSFKKRIDSRVRLPISSLQDWQRQAERLEKFGRKEQADAIKAKFSNFTKPPWSVFTYQEYIENRNQILLAGDQKKDKTTFNARVINKIHDHLLFYPDMFGMAIILYKSKNRIFQFFREESVFLKKILMPYAIDKEQRIEPLIKKYGPNHCNEIGLTPLMLATMAGSPNIARYLLMAGANPYITDNWGRCAYQLAFVRAYKDEVYAKTKLREMVELVSPPHYPLKLNEDVVGLQYGTMEFYVASIMTALQKEFVFSKRDEAHIGFQVDDIANLLKHFITDEHSARKFKKENLAAYMAKRDFISQNKPLLIKLRKGYYTFMLHYSIRMGEEWVLFRDLLELNNLSCFKEDNGIQAFITDVFAWVNSLKDFVEKTVEEQLEREEAANLGQVPDNDLRDWPV